MDSLEDGVDMSAHGGPATQPTGPLANIHPNIYALAIVLGALALLWLFGGVVFKSAHGG